MFLFLTEKTMRDIVFFTINIYVTVFVSCSQNFESVSQTLKAKAKVPLLDLFLRKTRRKKNV